MFEQPIKAAW